MKRCKKVLGIATGLLDPTNDANPPIPKGFKHVEGNGDKGVVIENLSNGNQYVWVPVSDDEFNEALNGELPKQFENIKKNGGFYISRYNISKNPAGELQSIKGAMPWVGNFDDAKKIASTIEDTESVKSYLPSDKEYDLLFNCLIEMGVKTSDEIAKDSTKWGNYWNTENSPMDIAKTGSREEWSAYNISDLAGNIGEWTQSGAVSGGCCFDYGNKVPVARRDFPPSYYPGWLTGIRSVLSF